ncbi:MAG: amidohydrolase [Fidelibacterota bacterium]
MTTLFTITGIYGHPDADAVLCRGGRILAIGGRADFSADSVIDLGSGMLYPGFTDSHLHLLGLGWSMEVLNLIGTPSPAAVLEQVATAAGTLAPDTWIEGRGWDQNDWQEATFPHRSALDRAAPDHPVCLRRIDGHMAWVNSRALAAAGIDSRTPDPPGGIIARDDAGQPTGILIDNAMELLEAHRPRPDRETRVRQIRKAVAYLNSLGLTMIHDAGTERESIEVLEDLIARDSLPIRVYAMLEDKEETVAPYLASGPVRARFLTIRAIKLYLDGAMGSRGAALLAPYHDDPDNTGLLLMTPEILTAKIRRFNAAGFQVGVHAIGDRANRLALTAFADAGRENARNRIEHAQNISAHDLSRFHEAAVIPVMQATHCTSDMYWVAERLGKERLTQVCPWRSLVQAGSIIPGGSDAPVESPDPRLGIYAAITRQDTAGWPAGGWQPQEKLTLSDAIKMVTEWPARVAFLEKDNGQLRPGFRADFTVLAEPLSADNPRDILTNEVKFTILAGNIVYSGES